MRTQTVEIDIRPRIDVEGLVAMAETYEKAAKVLREGIARLEQIGRDDDTAGPASAHPPPTATPPAPSGVADPPSRMTATPTRSDASSPTPSRTAAVPHATDTWPPGAVS